ncbi:hypothetical protein H1R20_g7821, partial [Candolleomyces eurysporus]
MVSPLNPARSSPFTQMKLTRKWVLVGVFAVLAVTFGIHSLQTVHVSKTASPDLFHSTVPANGECSAQTHSSQGPWMVPANYLNYDHPTTLGRDNLQKDSHYVTSFPVAGFTNKFIAYMHLIYQGVLSNRIPIVPPIIPPGWVPIDAGMIPFGDLFNLTNLRANLRSPVLEWTDVKLLKPNASVQDENVGDDPTLERIGCWSTRKRSSFSPTFVGHAENLLKLDLSFTRVPDFAYFNETDQDEFHTKFSSLAALTWPKHPHPSAHDRPLMAKSRFGARLPPEDQLACFDLLYFVSTGVKRYEFENRWSPVWNTVGTHLTFTQPLMDITQGYLRRALKIGEKEEMPAIITAHIRRNDFKFKCKDGQEPPCYMPIHKYVEAVSEIQKELTEKRNIKATRVFVSSDETELSFWDEVASLGWTFFNHTAEQTIEKYGDWYPLLIDKVALSSGVGFVGTSPSTFSVLNARRVEDWNNGITKMLNYYI